MEQRKAERLQARPAKWQEKILEGYPDWMSHWSREEELTTSQQRKSITG